VEKRSRNLIINYVGIEKGGRQGNKKKFIEVHLEVKLTKEKSNYLLF
jgi:hypothetical protein